MQRILLTCDYRCSYHSFILPTINYVPDPEIELDCISERAQTLGQEFVLKNAFGFGGCNSCIVFRRVR